MVVPIDEPPDRLQGLITHELTHVFAFDLIPRNLVQRSIPLWFDEGLAEYERAMWDPLDLASIRQVVEHVYVDVDEKLWDAAEWSVQVQLDYLRGWWIGFPSESARD